MLSRPKVEIRQKLKVNRTSGILITVAVAILVRVFCVIYTIVWSRLVNNYKFSNDILCGINGSATIGADRNGEVGTLWEYVRCFSQWDGEYFLRLSLNETEYLYEQNHAFFPSLPLIIIFTKKLLPKVMQNADTCLLNVILALYAYHLYCMDYDDEWKEENKKFYSFLSNFVKSPYFYLDIKKYRNYENKTLLRNNSQINHKFPYVLPALCIFTEVFRKVELAFFSEFVVFFCRSTPIRDIHSLDVRPLTG
ncbi:GPI mannosyltransferase 2, putative [Plasmodium ovale curtisi]|uniref:GPI mannosyltransferase 2 n=1 Tax=Plasmodium ovale curtisi TaxID=864141 RepID=A0A1A8WB39_PLAOA|nr:GPI mannosyltransferase 2, putative [Plasmodium ovale curtisi]